ncbi:hypothetical protein NST07_19210 [Paenibacillus sp. FSL L8-0340]|uniref:hypothetical protein n=1 Tax=Paenibacillus sp. FSL L8-0340 TaxID=2954685 RepID=UPI0031580D2C
MTGAAITIEVRLAKSVLENEEGMNHLWVHLEPLGGGKQAVLELQLPAGIHWDGKAKGYPQDTSGRVIIEQPEIPNDLLLRIYTIQPMDCGLVSLSIHVSFTDHSGMEICKTVLVPLSIVDAEVVDEETVEIDEEVVRRVKEQALTEPTGTHPDGSDSGMPDCSLPKLIRYDPHYRSELEEKYRVEGTGL